MRSTFRIACLALSILAITQGLKAQSPTLETEPSQRDSLIQLQEQLINEHYGRKRYEFKEIDRLFRYEPPYPYNHNRGYDFLHAFAESQVRTHNETQGKTTTLMRLIQWATGTNFNFGKWQLGIDGIVDLIPDHNKVDGQWLGYELQLVRHLGEGKSIRLRTSNNYTLRSHQWFTENHLMLYYAPRLNGLILLSGGRTSRGTTHLTPEEIYRDYYGTLPATNSPVRDYEKLYLILRNKLSLGSTIDLSTSLTFEDRKSQISTPLPHHRALVAEGQLLWAPSFLNRSYTSTPIPIGFRRELGLVYKHAFRPEGIDKSQVPYSSYSSLEGFVRGCIPFTEDKKLEFKLSVGGYLSHALRMASDEKYFAHSSPVGRRSFRQTWATMPLFFTGGEGWTTQEFTFSSNHFLLSRTRAFGDFLKMDDALHAKNFISFDGRAYTEAGYSVGWGQMMRLGLFAGFDYSKHKVGVALRLSLPLFCLTSSWSERH